jgi:hypothetical protein
MSTHVQAYLRAQSPGDDDRAAAGETEGWSIGLITQLSSAPGMNSELSFAALTLIHDNITDVHTIIRLEQGLVLKDKRR